MQANRLRVRFSTMNALRVWLFVFWSGVTGSYFVMARMKEKNGTPMFQPEAEPLEPSECPENCEDLFSKMTDKLAGKRGKVQELEIMERGEPKSGTGFMMRKGTEALAHFCHFLQRAYGKRSCRIEFPVNVVRDLIFEPQLGVRGGSTPPCSCDNVDRVVISFSALKKHMFPVEQDDCIWSHPGGTINPDEAVCVSPDGNGKAPEHREALWECVRNAACPINDDRLQMAVLRDPRDVAISNYYYWTRKSPGKLVRFKSKDEFFLSFLTSVCKWMSIRYLLFSELLGDRSSILWYNDAVDNPNVWFSEFFSLAGLNAPPSILYETVHAQEEGGNTLGFHEQKLDDHPNGTTSRSYKDEISPEAVEGVDDILRLWLPPAYLDKLGVSH